jgi:adenine-specific DNA-methyltransferase
MNELEIKQNIAQSLSRFSNGSLLENGIALLNALGYYSERQVNLFPNNFEGLVDIHTPFAKINREKALVNDWLSVDILFQLTSDDIRDSAQGRFIFENIHRVEDQIVESYLFLAIRLSQSEYSRSKLAGLTREINKYSAMPVMILLQHGDCLTLAIIRRRLNKRDENKDVLEKVTLIKDIRINQPHRAHIEILADFHLDSLHSDFRVNNFVQLANAWERRLGTYALTERFYRDIANWYFATMQDSRLIYPRSVKTEEQRSMFLIRLLTRLIFCWFLQEKGLIQPNVFSYQKAYELLKDSSLQSGTYYRGILQNLFFATLNEVQIERRFRSKNHNPTGRDGNRGASQFYRYESLFHKPENLVLLFKDVPFLNGGLFECLDTVFKKEEDRPNIRFDDFSEEKENTLFIPNDIFFGKEHPVDLSKVYDDSRKRREKTRGLIDILDSYKFTIEENTPLEEEIALDPELLGKVFENLLASYNEDTKTTARKSTGSFYTPREIVDYMVDETLLAYLQEQVPDANEENLRTLLQTDSNLTDLHFSNEQKEALINAIDNVRVLDPACGSGAFPMGILQHLVALLANLDPNNAHWKQQQLEKAKRDQHRAELMEDEEIRKFAIQEATARVDDIQHSFDTRYHELDFARKLYLIENCIYGVDIQPIAVQIAKLRFFITLVVDQKTDPNEPNQGVRPLPNLETKLVAANSLLPLSKSVRGDEIQLGFGDYTVDRLREQLRQVRHEYFRARTPSRKSDCREKDANLRKQIATELQKAGWPADAAQKLASWDPYDPNVRADFLEPKWMFGGQTRNPQLAEGTVRGEFRFINQIDKQMQLVPSNAASEDEWLFDIVLGNPPYVRQEQIKDLKPLLKPLYDCYSGTADLFIYFYERGIRLLRSGGMFSFISSNKYLKSGYGEKLRKFLSTQTTILQLVDFGDAPVFTAIAYPSIIILRKGYRANNEIETLSWQIGDPIEEFTNIRRQRSFKLAQKDLSESVWQLETGTVLRLLDTLRRSDRNLFDYVNGKLYRGIITGLNEAFIIDQSTKDQLIASHPSSSDILKPFVRGRDVKRWKVNFSNQYLIKIESSENITHQWTGKSDVQAENIFSKTYPAIHAYLENFREGLIKRDDQGKYFWELRSCVYWNEFLKPKIIYPDIYEHQSFAFNTEGFFSGNTTYFIPTEELWLCGLFNSILIEWFYSRLSNKLQSGYLRAFTDYMKQIPVPAINNDQIETMTRVVSYAISLSKEGKNEKIHLASFENLINGLVYELFFPAELAKANLPIFDLVAQAKLPNLNKFNENEYIPLLNHLYETIFLADHPIRSALFSLRGLDFVRIIEEESNINIEASPNEASED